MSFTDLIKKRYSVRKYKNAQIEQDKLLKVLDAARIAPTGANREPFKIIVAQSDNAKNKLSQAANTFDAPTALIICGDKSQAWTRKFDDKQITDIDASIVTDHMMLQATELGLGSVWICNFNAEVIKKEFSLTDNLTPVNILALGYADEEPKSAERHSEMRKKLEDLVEYK